MTISRRRLKKQRKIHLKRPVKIKSRFTTKESHGVTPLVKKYWAQRYNLFSSRYDQGIRLDEEGWFSVTPEEIAIHHAQRSGGGVVIDCFAGIGGNAIQFATMCQHVVAIDIDPEKVALEFNNAKIYGVEDYIDFVVGDFFQLAPSLKMEGISRILSDELHKRVVIVDTSNEIGGGGNIPHPAIGGARRLQVPEPSMQHRVMIEAAENHMPEVIVIDEIGTQAEVQACHSIAERGVMLIGTAHGEQLENIISNPTLSDLIGGVETVTIGDQEARNRNSRKSIRESKSPPTFPINNKCEN